MLEFFQFFSPTRIVGGKPGFLSELAPELEVFRGRRAGVVMDSVIAKLNLLEALTPSLTETEIEIVAIYTEVPQDSDVAVVERVAEQFQAANVDLLFAIGGGSVIDTAKAANILLTHGGQLADYQGAQVLTNPLLPLVAVPTTVGTGSEVTMVAVVVDRLDHRKLTFVDRTLAPSLAVLDPAVTFTLPNRLVATTAMDALTHALEAFIDLEHSPLSDAFAVAAADMIRTNLLPALAATGYEESRANLQMASTMAGIAFNHSMVGIVHALAHALGGVAGVPHGLANALMLTEGLTCNLEVAADRIAEVGLRSGFVAVGDASTTVAAKGAGEDVLRARAMIATVGRLWNQAAEIANLPRTLHAAGVTAAQLDLLVERASEDGSLVYNPKFVELEEIREMYHNVMGVSEDGAV
ncbi:MAG: hypothetical protein A2201_12475 [Alicyclobacillus sp. RIFOXYA1_FULL_53_8]|nr:MAG: hypothetical protein A2201_12475 [Alicyclobacillus sp. RIFOXYA1_FULL_53_8]